MIQNSGRTSFNRRRALAIGANVAGGLLTTTSLAMGSAQAASVSAAATSFASTRKQIEDIIGAKGTIANGLLSFEIDRDDITNATLRGVPIKSAFQVNGNLFFENLGMGRVMMNSDLALKASEIDPFIDRLLLNDIVFQAEHQHFYDLEPVVWFIHFRATGDPIKIARGIKAALNVTATPFPQTEPSNPTTPLPAEELGKILGAKPSVGAHGIVNFAVPRQAPITLGGVPINPYLNVSTPISFQPSGDGGKTAAAPDFGMIASETQDVIRLMRRQGWDIGCLYNQETAENPQLYFSHQFKTGVAIELAHEIRAGLNHMDMKFM